MSANKKSVTFKSTIELARKLGFSQIEAELIGMKGSVLAQLDKERELRGLNNKDFSDFLKIPKSRWSSIVANPDKVTLDYLITLAGKCGTTFKLTKKAA